MGLVDYSSSTDGRSDSEEEEVGTKRRKVAAAPTFCSDDRILDDRFSSTRRKRQLPVLPRSYCGVSSDDRAAHQGRVRARPFVDGDYYAHVYVERETPPTRVKLTPVEVSPQLTAALIEIGRVVGSSLGVAVHPLLQETDKSAVTRSELTAPAAPLHVSLSHPLPLRRHLSETFARQVAKMIGKQSAFVCSLVAEPKIYYNQPKDGPRRAFLALRTAAGSQPLHQLLERLEALLKREHLPLYHSNPEFHASFAWWLDTGSEPDMTGLKGHLAQVSEMLRAGWKVSHVCVKIAKEVTRIALM